MPITSEDQLSRCKLQTNCVLVEWEFDDVNKVFADLVDIASSLPRTEVLESSNKYWHGICRSLVFRFPDDLEILKRASAKGGSKKGSIQVRSASRFGASDLGVNKRRVETIYNKLMNFSKKKPS